VNHPEPTDGTLDADRITALIRRRRTIKPNQFSDAPIDRRIVLELLENANWAPTHGMTQPWRFTVFTGDSRRQLAEFLASTYQAITPADQFKSNKYEGMKVNATLAAVVIAVGMKRQQIEKISEMDEIKAVACAVQNMHLTAAAYGLGGFWSTNVAAVSERMRDYLGLGPKDRALGLFYLGYPSGEWPTSGRDPIDTKVSWKD
jgi:nitroreductase